MKTTLAEMPRLHVFEYLLQLHQNMSGLEILRTQPYHRRSNVAAATSASIATTRDGNRKPHKKKAGNRKPHKKKLSEQVLSKFNCDNINYQQINEKKGKKNTRNVVKRTNNVVIQSVNNVEKKKTKVSLKRKLENVQQSEYSGDTVSNKKTTSNFDEGTLQKSCVDDSCIVNSCVEACVEESCDEQSCDEQLRIEEPSVEEIVNSNITENQEVFSKSSSSVHHMREPRLQKTDSKQVQNVYDSNLRNKWAHHSVNSEACEFPHDPKREKKLRKRERGTPGTEAVKIVTNEFQPHECPPASVGGDDSVFECKLQESIVMKDDSIIVITEDIIIFDGNALRNDVTQENAEILIEEPDIPENKSGIVLWENRMKTMAKQTRGNHNRKGMPRIKENKCRTRKVSYITEPVTCLMYTEGNVSKCNAKNTFILKFTARICKMPMWHF
nr:uncharacterized protein LOC128684797 [Cherax quadricarinatus]